jgi:glucose-6-phosphate isomerase
MSFLRIDLKGTFVSDTGLEEADISRIEPRLEAARQEVLGPDLEQFAGKTTITREKDPLDAGFFELPEKILAAYESSRTDSELGRVLATAGRLRETVDRVVVLGIGGSYMGARALMESCCHPYHNELSRAERGSRPRMYFEGNNVDNDASQGLLDLLARGKGTESDAPWSIIVISKSGGTLETAAAFRQFLSALSESVDTDRLGELVVPVTGATGKLRDLSKAIGCRDVFEVPNGVGGRFSVLSPVGLLPAATLGLDVVKLLQGAAAMNEHFRTAPFAENVVQQFVAATFQMYDRHGANLRIMSAWSKCLEAVGLWYDQLLAESLGKELRGATPLTVVNTRDLHSRAQQHQEGARDKYIINLIVESWRRAHLLVGEQPSDLDQLNQIADRSLPEIMTAAIKGTNQAYRDDGRPTADLYLPRVDEYHIGQLLQLLMIATVVEGRVMGINPYGQPGVEMYKQHMKRELGL